MAKDPNTAPRSGAAEPATSENRRRLLKAAASAAPVIATLQSGAALANASTNQCIVASGATDDDAVKISTEPDNWIRRPCLEWEVYDGDGVSTVYLQVDGTWYKFDGGWTEEDPDLTLGDCGDPKKDCKVATTKYCFAMWLPDSDNGEGPTDVHVAGTYPVNSNFENFQGLQGSCLCSIDAGFAAGTTAGCRS